MTGPIPKVPGDEPADPPISAPERPPGDLPPMEPTRPAERPGQDVAPPDASPSGRP